MDATTIGSASLPKTIQDYDNDTCMKFFRFRKADLQEFATLLWPRIRWYLEGYYDRVVYQRQCTIPFETGLLISLYRLSQTSSIQPDMERFFGLEELKISAVLCTFLDALHEVACQYLHNLNIFSNRWESLAASVLQKSNGAVHGVWGFIDTKLRKTFQPSRFEGLAYGGHRVCRSIKFLSVMMPDGLIATIHGPMSSSRTDVFLLGQSNLIQQLRKVVPLREDGKHAFQLYGNTSFPQCGVLFESFRNVRPGTIQEAWNVEMPKLQDSVDLSFKEISVQWTYLDFERSMNIFTSCHSVDKYYTIGAFLANVRCCCYGNHTSKYFGYDDTVDKLSMSAYLDLIP
jgi:hypothetical protein